MVSFGSLVSHCWLNLLYCLANNCQTQQKALEKTCSVIHLPNTEFSSSSVIKLESVDYSWDLSCQYPACRPFPVSLVEWLPWLEKNKLNLEFFQFRSIFYYLQTVGFLSTIDHEFDEKGQLPEDRSLFWSLLSADRWRKVSVLEQEHR